MSISEQVKELRKIAEEWEYNAPVKPIEKIFNEAADTIESLSAKLSEANMETCGKSQYEEMRKELKHSIIDLDADHYKLSEFMRVIDEVFVKYRNEIERLADGGGWILCENKMPPDGQKVLLSCKYMMFGYVTVGTIQNGHRGKTYIADEDTFMRSAIIAWKPLPEPYHEP